ncbi:MAG: inositol monophosphatase, partial [Candidatus Micrarchaeota archaeon]|nr:inositol monophosphatase [Candidatus Micrarchaeota archaeon]
MHYKYDKMEARRAASPRPNMYSQLSREADFAKRVAREAGDVMRGGFKLGMPRSLKSDNSPVTVFDRQINRNVIAAVRAEFPNHGVIGEEESSGRREENWVCDPIDGTIAFARGVPTATFSLALVDRDGSPRLGVVYDPWLDRMLVAERGKGAYLNGSPINVSSTAGVAGAVIGHCSFRHKENLGVSPFREPLQENGAIMLDVGSIVYMHMLVAVGEMDATITPGECHDLAASKILIDEARGRMTDITGKEQERYDGRMRRNIASNGLIHDALIGIM